MFVRLFSNIELILGYPRYTFRDGRHNVPSKVFRRKLFVQITMFKITKKIRQLQKKTLHFMTEIQKIISFNQYDVVNLESDT